MANAKRDAGREAFWRRAVQRQAESGLTVRAFCRREELAESNFYAWRRTIAERDREAKAERGSKAKRAKPMPAFVPVAVHGRSEHEAGIVIELGGGSKLRFAESIEPTRLAAFVHALEAEAAS